MKITASNKTGGSQTFAGIDDELYVVELFAKLVRAYDIVTVEKE